ncbi:hypothetical protein OsI_31313 [Oryza sativa Indica Group]|uniref:Uncharacterized protein n=1 Tax=Oryza sativa subsp. indica TaxID=39946 RepID=A2Z141_ORYSI|nr:hypothetical protein OsI_31313 [Oryza sativa Indica Group]
MAVVTITSHVPEAPVDDNVLDEALGEAEGVQEVLAETQLRTPHKAPLAGVVAAQRVLCLQLLVQMHQGCSQVACDSSRRRGSMCIARKDEKWYKDTGSEMRTHGYENEMLPLLPVWSLEVFEEKGIEEIGKIRKTR